MAAALECAPSAERLLAAVRARSASCGAERVRRALLERLAPARQGRVLELGPGSGRLLLAVGARSSFVAGVEPDEVALRHAQRRCESLVREGRALLVHGTSRDLRRFEDASFDQAYGVHVAYFWEDPVPHLLEVRRVLRPGGRLLLGYSAGEPGAADPARCRTAALEQALRAAGFASVRSDGSGEPAWTEARR